MVNHSDPSEPTLPQIEPAAIAEAARVVIVALVALGFFTLDDMAIKTVASAAGVIASIVLTWWTRCRVVPVAKLPNDA